MTSPYRNLETKYLVKCHLSFSWGEKLKSVASCRWPLIIGNVNFFLSWTRLILSRRMLILSSVWTWVPEMTMILPLSPSLYVSFSASFLLYRLLLRSPAQSVKVHAHFVSFTCSCGIISACVCPFGGQSIWFFFKVAIRGNGFETADDGDFGKKSNCIFFSLFFTLEPTHHPLRPPALGLLQSMSRSSRSVTVFSLSLSLTRCVTMATVGVVPSRTCLNRGNFVKKMDPTKMAICVWRKGKKRKSRENICPTLTILFLNWWNQWTGKKKSIFCPSSSLQCFFLSLSRCCHDQTAALYTCVGLPRLLLFDLCST